MPKRGKVKIEGEYLTTEEGADDAFSKLIEGCSGEIKINTPMSKHVFKRNKTNNRIRRIKDPKAKG